MSFNAQLINLLKSNCRFVDEDDELILTAVQDAVSEADKALNKAFYEELP